MLDIKFIRENISQIKEAAKNKKINIDFDEFLKIDDKRKNLLKQIDDLRTRRNEISNFTS
jgi:seryl-tRNA synthetase